MDPALESSFRYTARLTRKSESSTLSLPPHGTAASAVSTWLSGALATIDEPARMRRHRPKVRLSSAFQGSQAPRPQTNAWQHVSMVGATWSVLTALEVTALGQVNPPPAPQPRDRCGLRGLAFPETSHRRNPSDWPLFLSKSLPASSASFHGCVLVFRV